jgi:lysozyme
MNEQLLRQSLNIHEGKRYHLYKDSFGNWTIGVGRNLSTNGLSEDEIQLMLSNDIRAAKTDCEATFGNWYRNLDEVRQRVLVELCFNMGMLKLLKFKKMLTALAASDYDTAAAELADSLWAKQVSISRSSMLIGMLKTGKDQ